jgi:hypothetical protein
MVECKLKPLTLEQLERRLLREYLYLPGLSLSLEQAARLVGVDAPACQLVLNQLVNAHALARSESGTYVRGDRYRDLEGWKSLVRTRLAVMSQPPLSAAKAVRSARSQMGGDRGFAESAGPGL